jgi:hypothetical protein
MMGRSLDLEWMNGVHRNVEMRGMTSDDNYNYKKSGLLQWSLFVLEGLFFAIKESFTT